MSAELLALLVVGTGLYVLVTSLPFARRRRPLAERLRRFDVDVLIHERRTGGPPARRLLPWTPADAVLRPVLEDLAGPIRRLLGETAAFGSELDQHLRLVQRGTTPAAFVARQLLLGLVAALLALTLMLSAGVSAAQASVIALLVAVGAFMWPQVRLRGRVRARRRRMISELPHVVWLMAVARSAGLGLDATVEQVARSSVGPLGEGLLRARAQVGGGVNLVDALEAFAAREQLPELTDLVSRLRATDELGLPLVQALEDLATSVQEKSANQLLEQGEKGGLKALLPLGLGMLPISVAVTVTPGILVVLNLAH